MKSEKSLRKALFLKIKNACRKNFNKKPDEIFSDSILIKIFEKCKGKTFSEIEIILISFYKTKKQAA